MKKKTIGMRFLFACKGQYWANRKIFSASQQHKNCRYSWEINESETWKLNTVLISVRFTHTNQRFFKIIVKQAKNLRWVREIIFTYIFKRGTTFLKLPLFFLDKNNKKIIDQCNVVKMGKNWTNKILVQLLPKKKLRSGKRFSF